MLSAVFLVYLVLGAAAFAWFTRDAVAFWWRPKRPRRACLIAATIVTCWPYPVWRELVGLAALRDGDRITWR